MAEWFTAGFCSSLPWILFNTKFIFVEDIKKLQVH